MMTPRNPGGGPYFDIFQVAPENRKTSYTSPAIDAMTSRLSPFSGLAVVGVASADADHYK